MRGWVWDLRRTTVDVVSAVRTTPDQFYWFTEYLDAHGMRALTRFVIAATSALTAIIPLINLASPAGAQGPVRIGFALTAAAGGLMLAALWTAGPWPTPRQSLLFIVLADGFITLGVLSDNVAIVGLAGATVFAAIGGYTAFFHSPRIMLAHIVWTCVVSAGVAVVVAVDGDPAMAISKTLVVVLANLTVPLAAQVLLGLLGSDSVESTRDPLTRLPNRRGLERALLLVRRFQPRNPDDVVVVAVLDLDAFKRVNDVNGHDCGDRVLAAAAHRIAEVLGPGDIPCRMGGEEFVVVSQRPLPEVPDLAERVRAAVLVPDQGIQVSASVGVAWVDAATTTSTRATHLVDTLIRQADRAMYEAKRAGGNRVHFHSERTDDRRDPDDEQSRAR